MTMSDPLGDMLTRIRNGQHANKRTILCPNSGLRKSVCGVLKSQGFIEDFEIVDVGNNKQDIVVTLRYAEGQGVIREMKRVSTPGRRVYRGANDLPRFYNGLGILVVSTPKGVMSDHEARAANVGGEVLCQVF